MTRRQEFAMQADSATPPAKSNAANPVSLRRQKSILGFFQKSESLSSPEEVRTDLPRRHSGVNWRENGISKKCSSQSLTPAPSSDAAAPTSSQESHLVEKTQEAKNGLLSPLSPAKTEQSSTRTLASSAAALDDSNSPPRKAKKRVNYAESDDEEEQITTSRSARSRSSKTRTAKRRRLSLDDDDSEDEFKEDAGGFLEDDEDIDDFVVPDDSDAEPVSKKRAKKASRPQKSNPSPSPPSSPSTTGEDLAMPRESTAKQWTYDPSNPKPPEPRKESANNTNNTKSKVCASTKKAKAHTSEPEQRYPWLAKMTDADRNPPGHPDYDPRTIYIPPLAFAQFSPFEKQYWEIKQKFWDTIVFFKKGKFYELYENDATIGHQLFDLKLTDRVNMRMVGVPEMSLRHWANQFVAKGYKIARVDQAESALGKEMRERDGKETPRPGKQDKIIRRELAQVLTAGTLVDGGMLQDDMSTYCVSIKEDEVDGRPSYGVSFVDTATGQFFITEFPDDADMTRFETLLAQIRPQELVLEKGCLSVKALRILKRNTGPTTIWNYLKPGKEFWSADVTRREIDASEYFVSEDQDNIEAWPEVLREAKDNDALMSSFGALLQYLRTLKIERELVTIKNFTWYDPIKKASSLVLDGQTLCNLEIFANSFDGGAAGTLFTLLNRCVTPFGKRMFRQWVCHPLMDATKINARLDAVDALNADGTVRDRFTSQLIKIPDLERLISRVHAGVCRAQDFLRVLEGFEQIEYTMSLLTSFGSGEGVIGKLIAAMPDLNGHLKHWKTAFDRSKARDDGILVPEPGVEEDFDESQSHIENILAELDALLKRYRRELGSSSILYRDNGKEIYQLEVPVKVKGVPRDWSQMSATAKVKRYYSPELRDLVRRLQEAQETHGQIVKEVAGRFYARFDQDYVVWLAAIKLVGQLDCLISLAKASSTLGEPSCRPEFVDEERSEVQFEELRHPCMLPTVTDFIPNDIKLGGESENISLLTGANAAGKSTILRMTCIAVIMAQIGCYVPCKSARLTPVDRIMSRLGANDNIFGAQSTFFVELSETKKILSEATPRSLVILDELGRGTSSYDGVAVAQAVLHHVATHVGCTGFFATHYHSLAQEFNLHPEIRCERMAINVDEVERRIAFLFRLEEGVAEGSFGMHCAAMCGIPNRVISRAETAARDWEHTSKLRECFERDRQGCFVPLGVQSDVAWAIRSTSDANSNEQNISRGLDVLLKAIEIL